MGAFLGAVGLVGVFVGIVLIVLGLIKKRKFKGGLITIISFVMLIGGIMITVSNSDGVDAADQDETDTYKVSRGEITNEKQLINLAVRAQSSIEKYDKLDNVTVDHYDIEAEKQSDFKNDETEEIYENVYYVSGLYSWQDKKYDFVWVVSFEENNVDADGVVLQYTSEMGNSQLNIDRSAVE